MSANYCFHAETGEKYSYIKLQKGVLIKNINTYVQRVITHQEFNTYYCIP